MSIENKTANGSSLRSDGSSYCNFTHCLDLDLNDQKRGVPGMLFWSFKSRSKQCVKRLIGM